MFSNLNFFLLLSLDLLKGIHMLCNFLLLCLIFLNLLESFSMLFDFLIFLLLLKLFCLRLNLLQCYGLRKVFSLFGHFIFLLCFNHSFFFNVLSFSKELNFFVLLVLFHLFRFQSFNLITVFIKLISNYFYSLMLFIELRL